jgi:DNA-binding response OmpR family regulator
MKRTRLLFVDDEPAIRLTLPAILTQEGFEVTAAASVPQALEYIHKERFDVLLTDLNIGAPADGFTLASAMRRTQPEAIILILTGYPDFDTALEALREQIDDYLTKPADIKQLVSTIKEKLKSPARMPPLQSKRVSAVLRENADSIAQGWVEAVSRDKELSGIPLSKNERLDHVPGILTRLADKLDSAEFARAVQNEEAARSHGRKRREQGYSVPQLLTEARILHNFISATVQENLLSIDLSTFVSDLLQIGESLHEQVEWSVRAFAAATRILLISFDPRLEETRALLLREAGYDITSVSGTSDAKRAVESSSAFDLVVVGNDAPRREREYLLGWLRRALPEARILMLTKAQEGGFSDVDCIVEPLDPRKVLDTIQQCAPLVPRTQLHRSA